MKTEVHNELTQEQRRAVQRDSLHTRAVSEANTISGRYAAQTRTTVTGSAPIDYPRLPPDSPWASDPVPAEGPLGYSIDEHPPVGELFEQSMCDVPEGVKELSGASPNEGAAPSVPSPLTSDAAPSSPPKRGRKR
jgi:hypothetical protein